MRSKQLKVALIAHTPGAGELAAVAARLCYSGSDIAQLQSLATEREQSGFLRGVMSSGHLSVVEHASFTFAIEGVSRALLAQLTRHRIASFSVQSQRYVSFEQGFDYVTPPAIRALGQEAVDEYDAQMAQIHRWYQGWQNRLGRDENGNEDARFVLPKACETRLILTMNTRELLHFFSLRCCNRAQWEIRDVAEQMLWLVKKVAPHLFAKAGPACLYGPCPEGKMCCGHADEVRTHYAEMSGEK